MKKVPLLRILTTLSALTISSCASKTYSSFQEDSSFKNDSSSSSLISEVSSNEERSSSEVTSSSTISSSSYGISSSKEVSSSSTSSSVISSSNNEVSSSVISSSNGISSSILSSSSYVSSSELISSSSSSFQSSSSSSSSSYSSSASSNSSSSSLNPLDNYVPIENFSKRMPGEFEPCQMVKMCYPNNMPLSAYKEIAKDNKVLLLVNPAYDGSSRIGQAQNALNNAGVNMNNITFLDMPIDDDYAYWVRDFSPFYVFKEKQLSIVDFTYNRPRYEQNAVPKKLSEYFDIPYSKMTITHTGGNLMQDGRGTAFSDDLVIKENSSKLTVTRQMLNHTGTTNYVITKDPQGDYIAHIDCWGKIVAPDKIIVAKLPTTNPRYQEYEDVAELLGNTKCAYGYNYRIYRIEEPGGNVVAPYTNSLIANNHVYMPLGSDEIYNQKALEVYRNALPGYEIVGIEGFPSSNQNAFLNTDALHCRTHEIPDQNMLFIDSREVYNGEVELKEHYVIKTNVVSYANQEIENVNIHYSINNGSYVTTPMNKYLETNNYTYVFKGLKSGDDVKYYIDGNDTNDNYNIDPTCGEGDPHHFVVI